MNSPMAELYSTRFLKLKEIVTPTVVVYEVYKILKRERGRDLALEAAAQMAETHVVGLKGLGGG